MQERTCKRYTRSGHVLGWREAQGNRNRNENECAEKMDETMRCGEGVALLCLIRKRCTATRHLKLCHCFCCNKLKLIFFFVIIIHLAHIYFFFC